MTSRLRNLIKKLARAARSNVWILDGIEPYTGKSLRIFFAGGNQLKVYITQLAFSGVTNETSLGKLYLWNILYALWRNTHDCALAIIEGEQAHQFLYQHRGDYYVPSWIWSSVPIPLKPSSKGAKEDLRRIRKNGLTYQLSNDPGDLLDFYDNIYLPTIQARHENTAVFSSFDEITDVMSKGDNCLLLVKHEEKTVAGVIILMRDVPRLWLGGIRDSNDAYRRMGAVGATYFFPAMYLSDQGYQQMDLGRSRSFFNDGVFRYKSKWDHRLFAFDKDGLILKVLNTSDAAAGFLCSQPFACIEQGELNAAIFVDTLSDSSAESQKEIDMLSNLDGLAAVNFYSLKGQQGEIRKLKTVAGKSSLKEDGESVLAS
ncbi:MAG: hypothetical protein ACJAUG_002268 [Halioglobus sp.]|jgi:hypothetical protein